ncbi:hypothetical protein [uncultured Pseudoteredinibacter sp.]|uniref:hypothetical protein n=1 Tax=uncultured Pseudoteredinibacter sp. TaxID=1641701 RepID=UPI00262BDD08|nr:hypothetical protein [uncultured Pseudoteredinibacter sp.]
MRKTPRDFVHIDEMWDADPSWESYFLKTSVWVYADTFRAELAGDSDYARIVIQGGDDLIWIYSVPLNQSQRLFEVLDKIEKPVKQGQLELLGFNRSEEL